jgi:pimeloyl-ACP methyl ester carboxylesterase
MPIVEVNGVKLHYEEAGSGPPLLLISGLGQNRLAWATVVPELSKTYRCITFDNRGTGQSEVPDGPYSMNDLSDDAAALIEYLDIGPVPAIGWSMGGVVLQSMLIDHGQLLSRAVLLSTLPSYTGVQDAWLDGLLALRQAGASPVVMGASSLPWAFTPYTLVDHGRTQAFLELGLQDPEPTTYAGFAAQARGIREFDRRDELHTVTVPTLVLVGAEDVLTPPSQAVEMAERIPGAKLVVLPRGGHGMIIEFPMPTLQAIEDFMSPEASN